DFSYGEHITDPYKFKGAPNITSLAAHKKILDFAAANHKPVWFDVHIWNDRPRDPDKPIEVLVELIDHLAKLSPSAHFKICVFEENANNHLVRRAIAHARAITAIQRLGDKVPILCCANCLQSDGQNDNGWDQGLLFLNPSKVWLQPPGYVTRMFSRNYQPLSAPLEVTGGDGHLDASAKVSEDGKTLVLQVVNAGAKPLTAELVVNGFQRAAMEELAAPPNARNTAAQPDAVTPSRRDLAPRAIEFKPYSF